MEVIIKLSEDEQELLLRKGDYYRARYADNLHVSVADKIRRAREDVWAMEMNIEPPKVKDGVIEDGHTRITAMKALLENNEAH